MSMYDIVLILVASFFAGMMNAIAGGGTFFSFPALLAIGVPPIIANATNNVALWPASLSSAWAYKDELKKYKKRLVWLGFISLIGGILGSLLLLSINDKAFTKLIPWLLLFATILFALSNKISTLISNKTEIKSNLNKILTAIALLLVSIYGGFFGAGLGILLIAHLIITEVENIGEANALKNYLTAVVYSVSVIVFIVAGAISWKHTLIMLMSASFGGYFGAILAKRISTEILKLIIIAVGLGLSCYYFAV